MKLTLEKAEIVAIIGKHFELTLDANSVVVRTDPLEIELMGIPLTEAAPSTVERAVTVAAARISTVPASGPESDDLSPAQLLAQSRQLESELDKKDEFYARRKGGVQSDVIPAEFLEDT